MIGFVLLALLAAQSTLTDDVRTLSSAATNEERFEALTKMLGSRKVPFTVEPFTIDKPARGEPRTEGRNVVATIGDGAREIVIGAHYDAARLPNGSLSKGAVDDGAASVILMRLAERLLSERLQVRVRVVWFDMEELGLIGSQQYLRKHMSDPTMAMLNLDVDAYGKTILFGPERPDNVELRRTFAQTCAVEDVSCLSFPQMPPGDDRSFVQARIPTVSIGVLPAVEAHQLWLMMNAGQNSGLAPGTTPPIFQTIHTAQDTPDKVNEDTMGMMVRFALALVRNLERAK